MIYLINKIFSLNFILKLPKFRKVVQIFNITFIPTKLKKLPIKPHPIIYSYKNQLKYINFFFEKNKQSSFVNCKDLDEILEKKFKKNKRFKFLDYGGENIDFYMSLKSKFPNIKYYVFNQREIINRMTVINNKFKFKDFNICKNEKDVYKIKYDFINFGSSIQYIQNYEKIILKIQKCSRLFIFFSGITFFSNNEFNKNCLIAKQINLVPTILYCFFFNKEKFVKLFNNNNYFCEFDRLSLTDSISFFNFKLMKNLSYRDILFKRRKKT